MEDYYSWSFRDFADPLQGAIRLEARFRRLAEERGMVRPLVVVAEPERGKELWPPLLGTKDGERLAFYAGLLDPGPGLLDPGPGELGDVGDWRRLALLTERRYLFPEAQQGRRMIARGDAARLALLLHGREPHSTILVGARLRDAYFYPGRGVPWFTGGGAICIPDPSPRCRVWNDPAMVERCRRVFAGILDFDREGRT